MSRDDWLAVVQQRAPTGRRRGSLSNSMRDTALADLREEVANIVNVTGLAGVAAAALLAAGAFLFY